MLSSDTWTSSLGKNGSGHFKKQWLMKNTEETKEVPDVNEIIREELRSVFRRLEQYLVQNIFISIFTEILLFQIRPKLFENLECKSYENF